MKKPVLIFGVLAGILIFAYTYVMIMAFGGDFSKFTPDEMAMAHLLGYIRYLLLLLGIVMAMHTYRKNTPGPIPYARIFMVGLMVSLVVAFFVGLMEYVYIAFTNPDFYDQYTTGMIEVMKQEGASAAEIEAKRQEMESFAWVQNPLATGGFYFVETSVIGTVLSLIAALFLRRKGETAAPGGTVINQPA